MGHIFGVKSEAAFSGLSGLFLDLCVCVCTCVYIYYV